MSEEPNDTQRYKINLVDAENEEAFQNFQFPVFTNYLNLWHYGHDVYLDVALLPIEQLNALAPGAEVTIALHDRYVMSPLVFGEFFKQANRVYEKLRSEGLIRDEQQSSKS